MYELEFDCVGQVSQGELTVTVEGRSQDGLTTKDPSTVIHSSTTTIDMTTSSQPIQIDATTVSHSIGYVVTNNASASVLEVTMAISISST